MEMEYIGARRQAGQKGRPGAARTRPGDPSWGRVLATTILLWTSRRLSRLRGPRSAVIAAICVLAVAAAAVGVVRLTGTHSRVARAPSAANQMPSPRKHVRPPICWATARCISSRVRCSKRAICLLASFHPSRARAA